MTRSVDWLLVPLPSRAREWPPGGPVFALCTLGVMEGRWGANATDDGTFWKAELGRLLNFDALDADVVEDDSCSSRRD